MRSCLPPPVPGAAACQGGKNKRTGAKKNTKDARGPSGRCPCYRRARSGAGAWLQKAGRLPLSLCPRGEGGRERGGSCHRPRRPRRHARSCTRTGLPPWPSAAAGRTPPIVPFPRPPLRHDSPAPQTRPPDPLPRCRLLGGKRKNGGYTLGSRVCVCVFLGWRTHTPANCVGGSF